MGLRGRGSGNGNGCAYNQTTRGRSGEYQVSISNNELRSGAGISHKLMLVFAGAAVRGAAGARQVEYGVGRSGENGGPESFRATVGIELEVAWLERV